MAGPRRKSKWGKSQARVPPDGTLRQSQAVTTFGPGATMDLVHQAVLVGGLDFWSWGKERGVTHIQEPRLRDAIAAKFESAGRPLSVEGAFREPPAGEDRTPSKFVGISVLQFPSWFVCQNPRCRALTGRGLDFKNGRYYHQCDREKLTECVPVRFLGACRRGHISDWPWFAFVHEAGGCSGAQLALEEGASGDFSQVIVRCTTCQLSTPLNAAYGRNFRCGGDRPWLGAEGKHDCTEELRLLVRTASNSYFPQVVSALSVPDPSHELDERVAAVWDFPDGITPEELPVIRKRPKVTAALGAASDADVLAAIERRKKGARAAREPLRTTEFRQFVQQKKELPGELAPEDESFFARDAGLGPSELAPGIVRVVRAHKLREVRAQIGFTRIEPVTPNLQGEFDLQVESAPLGLLTDWLPATEVRGEGVFLQLDEANVREWESRKDVVERGAELLAGYDAWNKEHAKPPPFPGVRFYMLHSLAHMLISAISLECGYAASAIRERIYCAPSSDPVPMAAILLSTGTSGTDGTLGGLVEQGRLLRSHLRRAFDDGELCSNDPVCAAHSPKDDPVERFLEGAACHGCLFVAECSCEWFNRYLDRALVVPCLGHPNGRAFFSVRP